MQQIKNTLIVAASLITGQQVINIFGSTYLVEGGSVKEIR